jgi:hypothetical protein
LVDEITDLLNRIDGAITVVEEFDGKLRERSRVAAQLARLLKSSLPRLRFYTVAFGRRTVTDARDFNEPTHLRS